MSPNRRIFMNIVATYGRSLVSLVCGLFISRWVLFALGKTDFGLYGVVACLTVFVGFFNTMLAGSIGRFYAVNIGKCIKCENESDFWLEETRKWFNTAITIHTLVPCVLIVIGYPIGVYIIKHFLVIPTDRIDACIWVFRFSCLSCFVSMVNVPFSAMYTAKQYIAELTIYSLAQTVGTFVFALFMVTTPLDWLVGYAFAICIITILPQLIICLRALTIFKECKFCLRYLMNFSQIKELGSYSAWQMFGMIGWLLRNQGLAILVNKFYGPSINASYQIANTVNGNASSLSSALIGAFTPAISTAYGAGDVLGMKVMSHRANKFGVVLMLFFMVPLSIELNVVLDLWLKSPPMYSFGLCLCVMIALIADKCTVGQMVAVLASGKVSVYQMFVGSIMIMSFPIAIVLSLFGFGVVVSVGFALITTSIVGSLGRVYFAWRIVGLSPHIWLRETIAPVTGSALVAFFFGLFMHQWLEPSLCRIALVFALSASTFVLMSWRFVMDSNERIYITNMVKKLLK